MNKLEFLDKLSERLAGIPEADRRMTLDYYNEIIDDRIESGFSEEEAVKALGSLDSIVSQVVFDMPAKRLAKEQAEKEKKEKVRRSPQGWEILLLILGAPLWISLLITVFAIILSVLIVIGAVVVSLYAIDFAVAISGLALILAGIILFITGHPIPAWFSFGVGLILVGVSILTFLAFGLVAKGLFYVSKMMLRGIRRVLFGRRNKK